MPNNVGIFGYLYFEEFMKNSKYWIWNTLILPLSTKEQDFLVIHLSQVAYI